MSSLIGKFIDEEPEKRLDELFKPKHEATVVQSKGKFRWTCVCGDQMEIPPTDDMDAVMRSYAKHSGLVEKRR